MNFEFVSLKASPRVFCFFFNLWGFNSPNSAFQISNNFRELADLLFKLLDAAAMSLCIIFKRLFVIRRLRSRLKWGRWLW